MNNTDENVSITYGEGMSNATRPDLTTTTTAAPKGLSSSHIGIIVGVLVAVLLITVVVLFIIFRRRRASKKSLKKPTGTSEVYSDTTAPLDEESRVMLKSGKGDQVEFQAKSGAETGPTTESSPLKEPPAEANESQATLVNNDGNAAVA